MKLRRHEGKNGELFRLNIAAHVFAWIVVGLIVVAIILFLFWISFDKPHLQSQAGQGVRPGALFNATKLALAVVAGIGGVVALVVAFRRQRLGEADHERQEGAITRDQTRLFNERFARATEQLGSDHAAVRVAGVYALAGLADDWPTGRQTCVDVLCAYLRMPFQLRSTLPEYEPEQPHDKQRFAEVRAGMEGPVAGRMEYPASEEYQVRSTIIRAMRDRMSRNADSPWSNLRLDLTGAIFDGTSFDGFVFDRCDVEFADCIFVGRMSFAKAEFIRSSVRFVGAFFFGEMCFDDAHFEDSRITMFGVFGDKSHMVLQGFTMKSGTIDIVGPQKDLGGIRFQNARLEGGDINIYSPQVSRDNSIDFTGANITGTAINVYLGTYADGAIRFNDATLNGGRIVFGPNVESRIPGQIRLAGTEFSFDGLDLRDGTIRFGYLDIEGSVIHFDDLVMSGGEIQFVDVEVKSGLVRMDRADVSGGWIDFGEIAETPWAHAITSEITSFVRPAAPSPDVR